MPEPVTVELQTLTPLWTGGLAGTSDIARATGIVGSLRWWFETILRGLGQRACDPTEHSCPDNRGNVCKACETYGATGLRRAFRVVMTGGEQLDYTGNINVRPRGNRQNRGWYLGAGLVGEVSLRVVPLRRDSDVNAVLLPLLLAARRGGLGAKTQLGYGVVRVLEEAHTPRLPDVECTVGDQDLPSLRDMFFAKVRFDVERDDWWKQVAGLSDDTGRTEKWAASGSVPIPPAIKDWLRFGGVGGQSPLPGIRNRQHAEFVFGKVQGEDRVRSRVCISCAYPAGGLWEFRVWGWLPRQRLPNGMNREQILKDLKNALSNNAWHVRLGGGVRCVQLAVWREYDSDRDTVARVADLTEYLRALLIVDRTVTPASGGAS